MNKEIGKTKWAIAEGYIHQSEINVEDFIDVLGDSEYKSKTNALKVNGFAYRWLKRIKTKTL